jgi:hypothetical protein
MAGIRAWSGRSQKNASDGDGVLLSLRFGFLEPLAHCALAHSVCRSDVFLCLSLFVPFPGAHSSSFAPPFRSCRFLAPTSLYRHSSFFLSFSLLRSILTETSSNIVLGFFLRRMRKEFCCFTTFNHLSLQKERCLVGNTSCLLHVMRHDDNRIGAL